MLKLNDLEAWIYRGFSGLYNLAVTRATQYREVPVDASTITRFKSLRNEFIASIDELEKFPVGEVSPDEWDAHHIACFGALLEILKLRIKYGSKARGEVMVKNLRAEVARIDSIIRGYEKLNERLVP